MLDSAFRSIIDIYKGGRPTIDREELLENFRSFQRSHIRNEQDAYKKIYHRILDHFKRYVEIPVFESILEHFEQEPGCEDVVVTLGQIKQEKPYIGGNYKEILRKIKETQDLEALTEALTEANEIAIKGMKVGKATLKGVESAIDHFSLRAREIRALSRSYKTEAQILDTKEIKLAKEDYEYMEKNQLDTLGIYTGIEQIDRTLEGLKHTELMIVGAYTSQGKTTFSVNVLYRAIYSGWDSAMITLEMTLKEMQTMMYVLHTSNIEVWGGTKYAYLVGKIDYNDALQGRLPPDQKEFYFAAMDDLEGNEDYGRLHIVMPDSSATTVEDVTVKCLEINSELTTMGRKLEFLCIDYIRLLSVESSKNSKNEITNLNNVIKDLKRLCISFNNGQGLRVLSPHQIKREGYVRALGNGGLYLLSDLSDTSEIEKSADVVITLFMDEALRKSKMFKVCCLKARRNELFDPFEACANLATKYMYSKAEITSENLNLMSGADLALPGVAA